MTGGRNYRGVPVGVKGWGFSAFRKQIDARERAHAAFDQLWKPYRKQGGGALRLATLARSLLPLARREARDPRRRLPLSRDDDRAMRAGDHLLPRGEVLRHRSVGRPQSRSRRHETEHLK